MSNDYMRFTGIMKWGTLAAAGRGRLRRLPDRLTRGRGVKIAVLKEEADGERRVAATPETVKKFIALGATLAVEAGAGADRRDRRCRI